MTIKFRYSNDYFGLALVLDAKSRTINALVMFINIEVSFGNKD